MLFRSVPPLKYDRFGSFGHVIPRFFLFCKRRAKKTLLPFLFVPILFQWHLHRRNKNNPCSLTSACKSKWYLVEEFRQKGMTSSNISRIKVPSRRALLLSRRPIVIAFPQHGKPDGFYFCSFVQSCIISPIFSCDRK